MTDTKLCTLCQTVKLVEEFGIKKNGNYNSWCKQCVCKKSTDYYQSKNPGARSYKDTDSLPYGKRDDPDYNRKYRLLNKYRLTEAYVATILILQENSCAICLKKFEGWNFSVDHDHNCCPGQESCGSCVRGFLCMSCNTGLGKLRDDTENLRRAISYLENNPFYDRRKSH